MKYENIIVIIVVTLALFYLLCYWESILANLIHGPRIHFLFDMKDGRLFEARAPIDTFPSIVVD